MEIVICCLSLLVVVANAAAGSADVVATVGPGGVACVVNVLDVSLDSLNLSCANFSRGPYRNNLSLAGSGCLQGVSNSTIQCDTCPDEDELPSLTAYVVRPLADHDSPDTRGPPHNALDVVSNTLRESPMLPAYPRVAITSLSEARSEKCG